jgi:hypothetical protein
MADPNPTSHFTDLLASDLEAALLLLSYAAQSGLSVDTGTAKLIARSKDLHEAGKLAGDDLAAFYLALATLGAITTPVTVAGLRAAAEPPLPTPGFMSIFRSTTPQSTRAIQWYWVATLIALLALVLVQIYWVVGSTALDSIGKLADDKNKARYELLDLHAKVTVNQKPPMSSAERQLTEKVDNLRNRIEAYNEILTSWNEVWYRIWKPFARMIGISVDKPDNAAKCDCEGASDDTALYARARFILISLQAYLLPLLYGLLGACTYVLRMLSRDIRAFSYTPDSHVRYRIRLVLGTLSGLAITWFFEPNSEMLKSLSPLALAFLAGYSVEVLFSALDRFVGAFSASGVPATGNPAPAAPPTSPQGKTA